MLCVSFTPGNGHALQLDLVDGTVHRLNGFVNRDTCFDQIVEQAGALGHQMQVCITCILLYPCTPTCGRKRCYVFEPG